VVINVHAMIVACFVTATLLGLAFCGALRWALYLRRELWAQDTRVDRFNDPA
jgi:hypothetical protein